jgi:hypothetical protein
MRSEGEDWFCPHPCSYYGKSMTFILVFTLINRFPIVLDNYTVTGKRGFGLSPGMTARYSGSGELRDWPPNHWSLLQYIMRAGGQVFCLAALYPWQCRFTASHHGSLNGSCSGDPDGRIMGLWKDLCQRIGIQYPNAFSDAVSFYSCGCVMRIVM